MRQNKIKGIQILAYVKDGMKGYIARITKDDGVINHLAIADPDTFVYNLDQTMAEYSRTGAPNLDGHKIEIK